jgi:hypothetical protein
MNEHPNSTTANIVKPNELDTMSTAFAGVKQAVKSSSKYSPR